MGAKRSALLGALACGYVLWHLATLTRSPLPYFDDCFFASIGETFVRTGEMRLTASPLWMDGGPIYLYGPAYFMAQGLVFRIFGLGIFQNRILPLIFGIAMIVVVFASLREAGVRKSMAVAATVLFALDPTLNLSLHGGRMDAVALCLVLVSFFLMQKNRANDAAPRLGWSVASGVVAALSVLSTPRPGYLVVLMGVILLARWGRVRSWSRALQLMAWSLPIAVLYLAWVAYAFGGIGEFLAYYGSVGGDYVGGRFTVRLIHYPLLAAMAAVIMLRRAAGAPFRRDELTVFALAGVFLFYALGINPLRFGTAYTVLTIPLSYVALATVASDLDGRRVWGFRAEGIAGLIFAALLAFNAAAFSARVAIELAQWRSRDPAPATVLARQHIPPGSRVIGDDRFYFSVMENGSDFQFWLRGGDLAERVAYQADTYRFDYVFTGADPSSRLFQTYAARVPLVRIAAIERPEPGGPAAWLAGIARFLRIEAPMVGDYGGTLFVRTDRDPGRR